MGVFRFKQSAAWLVCFALYRAFAPTNSCAEIVTFNMQDVALFSSTPPAAITATTGMQIPGGFDNTSAGNEFNLSSLQFDIDGDFDPLGEDPEIYFDLRIRTASFVGGQIVFDGFQHVFTPGEETGSFVVTKGENSYLNLPFAAGDLIGDGVDEFVRNGYGPPGPPNNNTFSVALDEGGSVRQFIAGVDNFLGFQLDTGDYGWIRVQFDETAPGTLTFLDGAYDTSGAPISAGGASDILPGDFNEDNSVDAADYTVWRNEGRPQEQYVIWKANFGRTQGAGSVSPASVPEPSVVCLIGLALGGSGFGFRRMRRTAANCASRV